MGVGLRDRLVAQIMGNRQIPTSNENAVATNWSKICDSIEMRERSGLPTEPEGTFRQWWGRRNHMQLSGAGQYDSSFPKELN